MKKAYEEHNALVENNIKTDPKRFFDYVKGKQKSNKLLSKMNLDYRTGSTSSEIGNLFADFFQNNYTSHSNAELDFQYFSYLPEFGIDITVSNISFKEIVNALGSLNVSKGAGPDGLPPLCLNNLPNELVKPLFWLFNLSLETGQRIPPVWKQSFLIPIFKNGKKSEISNYRGIAILSSIPKLFESIINDHLFSQVMFLITSQQHL